MLCTGWAKEEGGRKKGAGAAREGEHCSAYSPPLALKQQQEERENESGREGEREPQVRKRRGLHATTARGRNGALKFPLFHSSLLFYFFTPSCSGSGSASLSASRQLLCGILTMPGECCLAFYMSLAILCAPGSGSRGIYFMPMSGHKENVLVHVEDT